jgi:patatin-like phospholipase/acyl hydrolase
MNPLSIASLVASGAKALFGLGQGIFGAAKANKLWNNRPQLGVTAGEKNNDLLFNRQASATEMPGQKQTEEKLNQAVAEGMYGAQQSAPSSLNATQAAVDLSGKKMQAIQDLSGKWAEMKYQRQQALEAWNQQKIGLEQQRFQTNQYDPFMMQYGQAIGAKQQGANTFTSGIDTGLGILGDLQGTKFYTDLLAKLGK